MLCVEVGKDFVDMLIGFFILFVGCIIKFFEGVFMIYRLECKVVFWFLIIVIFFFGCFYFLVFRKGKIDFGEYFVMSFIFNIL